MNYLNNSRVKYRKMQSKNFLEINKNNLESKPSRASLVKLANKAGIKNLSKNNCELLRKLIIKKLEEITDKLLLINTLRGTKTVMAKDIEQVLPEIIISGIYPIR